MPETTDDPGPRNTITDNDIKLFLNSGSTSNKKENRTMGLFGHVCEFASVANLASWIAGTTNEVDVADDGDGTIMETYLTIDRVED